MALFKLAAFISVAVRRCAAEVFCGASDVGGAREGGIGFHSTGAAVLCGAAGRTVARAALKEPARRSTFF